ncbi:MAG: ArsR family transcriptional regulator [Candidatus Melainabacteria bacterium]|nr:ArsR family transcriptional regulator [Candidatus Melainabacteria bacterium]
MITRVLNESPERTHEVILLHLKRWGEMTVADLCQALDITSMAVRRHLASLASERLVVSRIVKQARGRPTYRYRLTSEAENLFPSGFEGLARDLLDTVYEVRGHKGVMELLSLRNQRLVRNWRHRLEAKGLSERVCEVAKIFSENGYMTEWQALPDGNFVIYLRHCALRDLAPRYRQLCVLEPRLMESLLDVRVTRKQYMLKDDPVCAYLVHAQDSFRCP